MFQDRCQQVINRVRELVAKGNQLYKTNLSMPVVRFDIRGTNAGQAYRKGMEYGVRFNRDLMLNAGWDHLFNDTVPHEVAHLFGFYTGRDLRHGPFWANACRALGGSGRRCHSEEVNYANGKTYYYTTSTGHVVALSSTRHNKIQRGISYSFSDGKGIVSKSNSYSMTKPAEQLRPVVQPPVAPPAAPRVPKGAGTNADRLRAQLRVYKADLGSEAFERTVQWAVMTLGMTRSLARSYVKNNWNKV